MTPDEMNAIGKERYGTARYLWAMHEETGLPYITLWRYSHGYTSIKPLAAEKIEGLKKLKKRRKARKSAT